MRGRHLPPACPVGAAPRRPWSGGPGSAAAGDGRALGLHHGPEGEAGAAQAPARQQAGGAARRGRRAGAPTARLPSLTARPRPQPQEPELGVAATTARCKEGERGPVTPSPERRAGRAVPRHDPGAGSVPSPGAPRARSLGEAAAVGSAAGPYHPPPRGRRRGARGRERAPGKPERPGVRPAAFPPRCRGPSRKHEHLLG